MKKYNSRMIFPTQKGFTLIELLITISIIAVLVSLGYPSYQKYLDESRRIDGQTALLDLANRMENYYGTHNTYASATLAMNNSETDILPNTSSSAQWYILSIVNQDDSSYLIQATPQKAQTNDTDCQSLTLSSVGEKNIAEGPQGRPTGTVNECWRTTN